MTVQSQPNVDRDLRLAARKGLLPARGGGWLAGFGNMLAKELGEWFNTRRWLWQVFIWVIIIGGYVAFMLFVLPILNSMLQAAQPGTEIGSESIPPDVTGVMNYFTMVALAGTIGVIILAHDEVIQEKQSGTAAWILSKPAARQAFILTKLLSNAIGALVFIIALPGLVVLGEIFLATQKLVPLAPFLAGAGLTYLGLIFYLSLVILLGVLFGSRPPVMGIAFVVMLGGTMFVQFFPQFAFALPFSMDKIATMVASGMPLPQMAATGIIVTVASSIGFILAALLRFQHIEL